MDAIRPLWRLEWRKRPNILSWGRAHTRVFETYNRAVAYAWTKQHYWTVQRGITIEWTITQIGPNQ